MPRRSSDTLKVEVYSIKSHLMYMLEFKVWSFAREIYAFSLIAIFPVP